VKHQLDLFDLAERRDWSAGNYRMESSDRGRFCVRCRWCSEWNKPRGFGHCELKRRVFPEDPRIRLAGVCDYFEVP
jgi:hypothetical protein